MFDFRKSQAEWLKYILRPVIRFCVRRALPIQTLTELAKQLYVEAAEDELVRRGEEVTISRMSVMTGVHRKETGRLAKTRSVAKDTTGVKAKVIGQWLADTRFQDSDGRPRVLRYKGSNSEFKQLVATVSRDFNPATVLFELERINAVEQTEKGVSLKTEVYQAGGNVNEGFELLGRDIEALIHGVECNLLADPAVPNLHAKTEFDNIYQEDLPMISEWLLREGSLFHKRVRDYLSQFDKDINPEISKTGGAKVVVGAFSSIVESAKKTQKRED